jgi:hypothetical protein
MDAARFDALVRAARRSGSRRGLLGGLAALALAPLAAAASPEPAACLGIGKRCTLGKGAGRRPACARCCSRFGSAGPNGKARCACKGNGVACANDSQCCSGACRQGGCCAPDCAGKTCGQADGCGGTCTTCPTGQRCVGGACIAGQGTCPTGTNSCAAAGVVGCNGSPTCACYVSTEEETRCADNFSLPGSECGECRRSHDCVVKFPAIPDVFCAKTLGTQCCDGKAAGFCNAPCPVP